MRDGYGLSRGADASSPARVRDVADFQNRWAEFRPFAARALRGPVLSPEEADTLAWMIEVMDRIGARDVADAPPRGEEGDCRP